MITMGFSGKSFTVNNGVHSGSTAFQQDRDAGTKILASRVDYALTDMATNGFNRCFLVDGTGPDVTADLPMNDNGFTGMKDGAARTSSATVGQVQDGGLHYGGASGGAGGFSTISLSPAITAYADGMLVNFRLTSVPDVTLNTLNINGLGAKAIKRTDGVNAGNSDLIQNEQALVIYDSAQDAFILQSPGALPSSLIAIAGIAKTDSNIIVGNGSTWVAETGATARTSLGLGTGDSPTFTGVTANTFTLTSQPDYTITNPTTLRTLDVGAAHATLGQLDSAMGYVLQVLGTLINDLITAGLLK